MSGIFRSLVRPTSRILPGAQRAVLLAAARPSQRWQIKLNSVPRAAGYSSASSLSKEEIEARVLDVFKGFEKVDPTKVTRPESCLYIIGALIGCWL
jgi:NADH dehydrogenase (ubiquinone) 1 alpha/beta subcomplex 1